MTQQSKMVCLTDGSEKEELVVRRTMRKIRTLCHYNSSAAQDLVRAARKTGYRPPSRASWDTFRRIGLLTPDGKKLDETVREIVLCAFDRVVVIPGNPQATIQPHSPIMHVDEEENDADSQ